MLGLFGICMSTWKFTKQSDDAHGGTMVPVVLAPTLPPAARRPAWRSPAARRWGLVVVMSLVLLALGLWALPPKPSPGPPFTTEQQRRLLEQQRLREAQQHLAKDKRELEEERQRPKVTKPRAQPQVAGKAWRNSIGMEFVLIPTGTFQMGANDQDVYNDAQPVHQVRISKPFYLGKYEVTQEQWRTIMGNNPSRFKGAPRLPVENVSWEEVQEFIRQLNAKEGGWKYRLPTEAEWEYAGRAGTTTAYSFGDDAHQVGEYAWHGENSSGKTHPVGQKKPNPWGLYDMHGNVWEWVQDWYGPYTAGAAVDPAGPSSGSHRVYRGGSWGHSAKGCRSAFRSNLPPGLRYAYLGFRLLRTAE